MPKRVNIKWIFNKYVALCGDHQLNVIGPNLLFPQLFTIQTQQQIYLWIALHRAERNNTERAINKCPYHLGKSSNISSSTKCEKLACSMYRLHVVNTKYVMPSSVEYPAMKNACAPWNFDVATTQLPVTTLWPHMWLNVVLKNLMNEGFMLRYEQLV